MCKWHAFHALKHGQSLQVLKKLLWMWYFASVGSFEIHGIYVLKVIVGDPKCVCFIPDDMLLKLEILTCITASKKVFLDAWTHESVHNKMFEVA